MVAAPARARRGFGRATCDSCGAPIVFIQTAAGRRMPVDPVTLRASREGDGRLVTLVDETGAVRPRLHLDPEGDIIGWEPHWGSCTRPERHRRQQRQAARDTAGMYRCGERGAYLRCRRVGLDLHGLEAAQELLGTTTADAATELYRIESGEAPPRMGWGILQGRLVVMLRRHVAAELAAGKRWQDIRVPGWSAAEIRDAARAAAGR